MEFTLKTLIIPVLLGFVVYLLSIIMVIRSSRSTVRAQKYKHKPSGKIGYALLLFGTIALISSILYSSSILAFIGMGLTFWGAILLYIQPEEYTKKVLLDATLLPSLAALDQIMQELDYKGKAIYLPPKYLNNPEANKVYISKQKDEKLPTPELILKQESKLFIQNPQGILLTPPGAELTKLFEETLDTSFTRTDLQYLQQNMPKLFIEDLEIAEDLEIQIKYGEVSTIATDPVSFGRAQTKFDTIHVKITNSVYKDMCKEARKLSRVCDAIGCPICGAIACALAKATGKPVIIEETEVPEDGKTIEANFRLLETIESEVPIEELLAEAIELKLSRARMRLLLNLAGLFLTAFGSITLAWVGQLTWYDMTAWGKDIGLIFFGSRTGEAISLGIGMKVIYYFLIGLALLLSGLLTFLRRQIKV